VPVASEERGSTKSNPAIALDGNGHAQAVWIERRAGGASVHTAEQQPDGTWGDVRPLTDTGKDASGRPRIVIDTRGSAYAVWTSSEDCGGPARLQEVTFAERPAGDVWQQPVTLAAPGPGAVLVDPVVAANDDGTVYIVWGELRGGSYRLYSVQRTVDGDWGAPRLAAEGRSDFHSIALSLAVSARGGAYLTWAETQGSQALVRFTSTR
jgi:hypothetical protein